MRKILFLVSVVVLVACNQEKVAPDFKIELGKVSEKSVFSGGDSLSIWGGSVVKGEDGLYHMLYSRWPKQIGSFGASSSFTGGWRTNCFNLCC